MSKSRTKTYSVLVTRIQRATIEVEADSAEQAFDRAVVAAEEDYDWDEDPDYEATDIVGEKSDG